MTGPISHLPDRPIVDESAKTWQRLEPITFMGERIPPWPAHLPLPEWPVEQADVSTLDLRVRAAPNCGAGHTQAPDARAPGGGSAKGVGGSVLGGGR